jgi:hypothetical protein
MEGKIMKINEAKKLRLGQIIYLKNAYNADGSPMRYRINGQIKTWKRNPEKIQVPLKRGLYEFGYLTEDNLHRFTL